MSYSESVKQKYFEVKAKCGHVGRTSCVWIRFAVVAESRKDAAKKARMFGRVKHNHQDAIGYVKEIDFESFIVLKAENDADPSICIVKASENKIKSKDFRQESNLTNSILESGKRKTQGMSNIN